MKELRPVLKDVAPLLEFWGRLLGPIAYRLPLSYRSRYDLIGRPVA